MSDKVLRIAIPNFAAPPNSVDGNGFTVLAKIDNEIVGRYNLIPFSRFDFIEQTERDYLDVNFFARRMELYEKPYLNDDGLIVLLLQDFNFNPALNYDYKQAFLHDSLRRIASKVKDEVADIYTIVNEQDVDLFEDSDFEVMDRDNLYGVWMGYGPEES